MIRLVRVELARFLARRAVLVLLVAAVVVPAVIGVATAIDSAPPSDDEIAQAQAQVDAESGSKPYQRELARCIKNPRQFGIRSEDPTRIETRCEHATLPRLDWYLWWDDLDLVTERESGSGFAVVVVLAILMLIAGTTFAGHDWASGSVTNQLLFEPRRSRVWLAKAVVVTTVSGLLAAAVLSAFWLALGAVARSRDLEVPGALLLDCLQSGWRGAGVAAAAALAGYALTMLFRSTVAALGVLLAVCVAGGVVLAVIGVESVWNPGLNIAAIVLDGVTYWTPDTCPDGIGVCDVERTLELDRALLFLGPSLLVACAASLGHFWRRDVG